MGRKSRKTDENQSFAILSKDRERRRIKRLGRVYNPNRHRPGLEQFVRNPKFRLPEVRSRSLRNDVYRLVLPSRMVLDDGEAMAAVFSAIAEFRKVALSGAYGRVVVVLEDVTELAPEVAVLLLAELQRCHVYCRRLTKISGTHPKDAAVKELLLKMGFYDALRVNGPLLPESFDSRIYLKIASGHQSDASVIDSLLSSFDQALLLSATDKKSLHVGILECMDNVYEHAYEPVKDAPHLCKEWWLVGFSDPRLNTASFIMYDQGYGIVGTVKSFKSLLLSGKLPSWSDERWLKRAVSKSLSRYPSDRRGHGLPRLKSFIDTAVASGSIRVIANNGMYTYSRLGIDQMQSLRVACPGTLIIWSIAKPKLQS